MSLFNYLILEPLKRNVPDLAIFRLSQIMQSKTNGKFTLLCRKLFPYIRPKVQLPESTLLNENQVVETASLLRKDGYKVLDFSLSQDEIGNLLNFCFSTPAWATDINEKINISPDNIPNQYGRYYWKMQDLIKNEIVQKLMIDSTFHKIAQEYIGSRPILSSITLWLDPVLGHEQNHGHKAGEYDPHIYHYDNDGPKFLKFFFYLTDVTKDSGAHVYIKGSHNPVKPQKFAESKRYTDQELLNHYGRDAEIVYEAPAGTIIAEDTMGWHKGSDPISSYRLLMQFEYGMLYNLNIPERNEEKIDQVHLDTLDSGISSIVRQFFKNQ